MRDQRQDGKSEREGEKARRIPAGDRREKGRRGGGVWDAWIWEEGCALPDHPLEAAGKAPPGLCPFRILVPRRLQRLGDAAGCFKLLTEKGKDRLSHQGATVLDAPGESRLPPRLRHGRGRIRGGGHPCALWPAKTEECNEEWSLI